MLDVKYEKLSEVYSLFVTIDADATGEKAVPIPFRCEVIDVIAQAKAAQSGGTVTLKKGTTAITDAMVFTVDKTITRAGTIDDSVSTLNEGDAVSVDCANAEDRGFVSILVRRLY